MQLGVACFACRDSDESSTPVPIGARSALPIFVALVLGSSPRPHTWLQVLRARKVPGLVFNGVDAAVPVPTLAEASFDTLHLVKVREGTVANGAFRLVLSRLNVA